MLFMAKIQYVTPSPSVSKMNMVMMQWRRTAEQVMIWQITVVWLRLYRFASRRKPQARKASSVFERLVAAGRRLLIVIQHNEGGANKDLAKFADQINTLCDKWDR